MTLELVVVPASLDAPGVCLVSRAERNAEKAVSPQCTRISPSTLEWPRFVFIAATFVPHFLLFVCPICFLFRRTARPHDAKCHRDDVVYVVRLPALQTLPMVWRRFDVDHDRIVLLFFFCFETRCPRRLTSRTLRGASLVVFSPPTPDSCFRPFYSLLPLLPSLNRSLNRGYQVAFECVCVSCTCVVVDLYRAVIRVHTESNPFFRCLCQVPPSVSTFFAVGHKVLYLAHSLRFYRVFFF